MIAGIAAGSVALVVAVYWKCSKSTTKKNYDALSQGPGGYELGDMQPEPLDAPGENQSSEEPPYGAPYGSPFDIAAPKSPVDGPNQSSEELPHEAPYGSPFVRPPGIVAPKSSADEPARGGIGNYESPYTPPFALT